MGSDLLRETIQLRFPRLLVSGVDYNDAQVLLTRIARFEDSFPEATTSATTFPTRSGP